MAVPDNIELRSTTSQMSESVNGPVDSSAGKEVRPVVLFLCTRNSVRSQMAEAWLRWYAGDRFVAASAGLEPESIHPTTIRVMEEAGIPLVGQRSKPISEYLGRVAVRHIIVVCKSAEKNCPRLWPFGGQLSFWPFEDPVSPLADETTQLGRFRNVRDQVGRRIQKWVNT